MTYKENNTTNRIRREGRQIPVAPTTAITGLLMGKCARNTKVLGLKKIRLSYDLQILN
jgi:hypothetical protein